MESWGPGNVHDKREGPYERGSRKTSIQVYSGGVSPEGTLDLFHGREGGME